MEEPFVGQIACVGFKWAPYRWAVCDGSTKKIADYPSLYQLIGTTYGGDGITTFGLPDLRGRTPIGTGQGPGLQNYTLSEAGGAETVTLTSGQLPAHSHPLDAFTQTANNANPIDALLAGGKTAYAELTADTTVQMGAGAVQATGMSGPHENRQPYLCCNWIIALEGIWPSQG